MNCTRKSCEHYGFCEFEDALHCKKFRIHVEKQSRAREMIISENRPRQARINDDGHDEDKVRVFSAEHGHRIISCNGEKMDVREVFN